MEEIATTPLAIMTIDSDLQHFREQQGYKKPMRFRALTQQMWAFCFKCRTLKHISCHGNTTHFPRLFIAEWTGSKEEGKYYKFICSVV